MSIAAVIVAAGRGIRFGTGQRKQFVPLGGKPLLFHSIEIFENLPAFDRILLVLPADLLDGVDREYGLTTRFNKLDGWTAGGPRRQDSVRAGLKHLPPDTAIVAIHDAVRPFAAPAAVAEAVERARRMGAAILAAPAVDTPKRCDGQGRIVETIPREEVWLAETPQVFRFDLLCRAYEEVFAAGVEVTDEAAAVERQGEQVEIVRSPRPNPKITTPDDLRFAAWLLEEEKRP
jgi:2-C-methyl-D-erythritol 4-phosphate cytidylyltransferase